MLSKDSKTIAIGGVALHDNRVKKGGRLVIGAECLGLKQDLNKAMDDRKYEINGRKPRECYALPLHEKMFSEESAYDQPSK